MSSNNFLTKKTKQYFIRILGSKNQDAGNTAGADQSSPDGFVDQPDQHDLQAIQNHNLLIALGGVAARRASGAPHFSMPVSCLFI